MAHTPNLDILKFILQDENLHCETEEALQAINQLPPLNIRNNGDPILKFLYCPELSIIAFADPDYPITSTQTIQEILSQEPILSFMGIEIYNIHHPVIKH